jgi:hypothetical protein
MDRIGRLTIDDNRVTPADLPGDIRFLDGKRIIVTDCYFCWKNPARSNPGYYDLTSYDLEFTGAENPSIGHRLFCLPVANSQANSLVGWEESYRYAVTGVFHIKEERSQTGQLTSLFKMDVQIAGSLSSIGADPIWQIIGRSIGTCIIAAAAILATRKRMLEKRQLAAGMCRNCGYDLRVTPGRCPECGWAAPTPTFSGVPNGPR